MLINNPKVSALTPIYNTDPEYLREMIGSILNQTFSGSEFLILNDSPDNNEIEKIVLEYAKKDKRIKYSKNDYNMGITPSRNKLLEMANGEYLAPLFKVKNNKVYLFEFIPILKIKWN